MISTFQPRQVEPKALRRWGRQALALLGRGVLPWSLLVTLGCLLIDLCTPLGLLSIVPCAFFGYGCYGFSVAIAEAYDHTHRPSWGELIQSLSGHAKDILRIILIPTCLTALAFLFIAVSNSFLELLYRFGVPHRPPLLPPLSWLTPTGWRLVLFEWGKPFLSSIAEIGLLLSGYSFVGVMSVFVFPAILAFGAPKEHHLLKEYTGLDGGRRKGMNARSVLWLHALHMVLLSSLVVLNLAFLAPVAIAFLCAMTYVAYRDIYLAQSENAKLELRASVQLLPVSVPISAYICIHIR